jgi:hypothetical protein
MMFSLNQSGARRRARNMGGAGGISRAVGCTTRPDTEYFNKYLFLKDFICLRMPTRR